MNPTLKAFLFPRITRWFLLRVALVAGAAWLVFGYLLIPCWIQGDSMAPRWKDGGFTFCWTGAFLSRSPQVGDVVAVKLAGRRRMLLKRIVAGEGSVVEFRGGVLRVDGQELLEPYRDGPCDWDREPFSVASGCVYVVGDNRSMSMWKHVFGEVDLRRIQGSPLW